MTTKMAAVERDEKGRVKGGALNPGGLTKLEREARDAVRLLFATAGPDGLHDEGINAYRRCLQADNPAIVKDFMDRLAGPVKARVSIEDDESNGVSPLAIMLAQFRALPREAQDKIETDLAKQARDGA